MSESKWRTVSPVGIALIKRFEGCRLEAYKCEGDTWTVGWGHTHNVIEGLAITQAKADELLEEDLLHFAEGVHQLVPDWLNRHQFDAIVSLTFNIGLRAFRDSTLRAMLFLKPPDLAGAAHQFTRFNRAGGKPNNGLILRRSVERELFERPMLRIVKSGPSPSGVG